MTKAEIDALIDFLESLWLEHLAAEDYLQTEYGVADPKTLLKELAKKIPLDAKARYLFSPVKQAIGGSLQASAILKALAESLLKQTKP